MSQNGDSGVDFVEKSNSFWVNCQRISDGCQNCYAHRMVGDDFFKKPPRRTANATFYRPLKWTDAHHWVFANPLADMFDHRVDTNVRNDAWDVIRDTDWLFWVIITKRPQNIHKMLPDDWSKGWNNVIIMSSAENQVETDRRLPYLLDIPAIWRGAICEPLLGSVDLTDYIHKLDWVIGGGESGHSARIDRANIGKWAMVLRDQCVAAGVPFFWKQWGSLDKHDWHNKHNGNRATIQGTLWQQLPAVELAPLPHELIPKQAGLFGGVK